MNSEESEQAPEQRPEAVSSDEVGYLNALRPNNFGDYIGQKATVESLQIAVKAARKRKDTLDHILLHGPPGLGKTTLANIVSKAMGTRLTQTSGPALERPADVVGLLTNLDEGDVFFIDEIHRLSRAVEEYLYSAMEDFRVDFMTGSGAYARTINLPLRKFTLIGSTTRAGMLSAPLRERFGLQYHLNFYGEQDVIKVIQRSANILKFPLGREDVAKEIAQRSRGTPRIANRLLRRVRDYAEVKHAGKVSVEVALKALELESIDGYGLDRLDRLYLSVLENNYQGGPAGIEALAATVNEEQNTLVDMVEPHLLKINFIQRTPQGRKITRLGAEHIGSTGPQNDPSQPHMDL